MIMSQPALRSEIDLSVISRRTTFGSTTVDVGGALLLLSRQLEDHPPATPPTFSRFTAVACRGALADCWSYASLTRPSQPRSTMKLRQEDNLCGNISLSGGILTGSA
jgi:hypothetical protein